MFYDSNDRLTSDVYDNNGNTLSSGGIANVYDFENHLAQRGAVTVTYDGDGNRTKKTAGGVTTKFLVDTNNPTGYAQVLEELQNNSVSRKYTYGLDLISESQTSGVSFYQYDGHGSVRGLTNISGAVTGTYTYDAFGNLIEQTGTTPNLYLYAGEQFDPDLNLYYNRARYLDVRQGRFWGMDEWEGMQQFPSSLHRYQYAMNDPVSFGDATGLFTQEIRWGQEVHKQLYLDFQLKTLEGITNRTIKTILKLTLTKMPRFFFPDLYLLPDLVDPGTPFGVGQVYEIKSEMGRGVGLAKVGIYTSILQAFDPLMRVSLPGFTYVPKSPLTLSDGATAIVYPPQEGVIVYRIVSGAGFDDSFEFTPQLNPQTIANVALAAMLVTIGQAILQPGRQYI